MFFHLFIYMHIVQMFELEFEVTFNNTPFEFQLTAFFEDMSPIL